MNIEPLPPREGVRILRLTGEVDVVSTAGPHPVLTARGPLVLDLTDVTFFDSSGVRLVDRLARDHAVQGHGVRVVAPAGGRARRVLEVLGYGPGLVADDLDAAVAQLRG